MSLMRLLDALHVAAETHETFHQESGMRYQVSSAQTDSCSNRGDFGERLTAWRRERARTDGVPAYAVADNKTLAAIAAHRPADESALLDVPGIGHRKIAIYGDEILRLVGDA